MRLIISPVETEYIYDDKQTNAINFMHGENGYFSIQICTYMEGDEELDTHHIELNEQHNAQRGGIKEVVLYNDKMELVFESDDAFLDKYGMITVLTPVERKLVDFFANHLFLGDRMRYAPDFDKANIVPQTQTRDYL